MITDLSGYARATARSRAARLEGSAVAGTRGLVGASWDRCLEAEVDPDRAQAPEIYSDAELVGVRRRHPLAGAVRLLGDMLASATDDGSHVMVLTDVQGDVLWREGTSAALRCADAVGLVEGSRWAEDVVGTNAMGTAIATRTPVQIHATEHLAQRFDTWNCAAAPIRDPATGGLLGTVDLSGPLDCFHPATLALVGAAARLAEREMSYRHGASTGLTPQVDTSHTEPRLGLRLLGPERPQARIGTRAVALTPRQADLLAVLAINPDGLSADELATAVYGEHGREVTVRAEVHRLRSALGPMLISAHPYRLELTVEADFEAVRRALRAGRTAEAAQLYRGPLLPNSEAPAIHDERVWLAAAVRRAVISGRDVEALWAFAQTRDGADDDEIHDWLERSLDARDPRRSLLRPTPWAATPHMGGRPDQAVPAN